MTKRILPENAILIPNSADRVFKGILFDVYQWQQQMFDGSSETFEMLRRPDTVTVVAINDDNTIVTLAEEQPNGIKREVSLPNGRVDEQDATILDAAKRELLEETGMKFSDWSLVEVIQPQRKIEWFVYVFVALGKVSEQATKHDSGEKIIVKNSDFLEFMKAKESSNSGLGIWKVQSVDELKEMAKNPIVDEL